MEACNEVTVMVKFNEENEQDQQLLFTRVPCINEQIIVTNATYRVDSVTHLADMETAIIEVTQVPRRETKGAIEAFMEIS